MTPLPRAALRHAMSSACRDKHHLQCSGYVGHRRRNEPRVVCVCTCHARTKA